VAGAAPDSAHWSHDRGDGCAAGNCGWGNQEKQSYTDAAENAAMTGSGALAITARVAPAGRTCYYGPCRFTSAKLKTAGKVETKYGRVEARIKLPPGQGLWPAFWMLGAGFPNTPWPQCGEIDIMEFRGSLPRESSSALHGPGYSGNMALQHRHQSPSGALSDDFHRFAVEWDSTQVRFFVDDALHYAVDRGTVTAHGAWSFDGPFYIILNLAVGGTFDGDPSSEAIFPATMLIDYVRVYAKS